MVRVRPGLEDVWQRDEWRRAFRRVDLPVLLRPRKAISGVGIRDVAGMGLVVSLVGVFSLGRAMVRNFVTLQRGAGGCLVKKRFAKTSWSEVGSGAGELPHRRERAWRGILMSGFGEERDGELGEEIDVGEVVVRSGAGEAETYRLLRMGS
jgi:hypothetical protein